MVVPPVFYLAKFNLKSEENSVPSESALKVNENSAFEGQIKYIPWSQSQPLCYS